mmetsp:Transcript_3413/g.6013  ORF Transcript_3413/g.6013 Transcript_3413/m.6013 type:complete len:201 (-) Transcript_3413:323-925(-)
MMMPFFTVVVAVVVGFLIARCCNNIAKIADFLIATARTAVASSSLSRTSSRLASRATASRTSSEVARISEAHVIRFLGRGCKLTLRPRSRGICCPFIGALGATSRTVPLCTCAECIRAYIHASNVEPFDLAIVIITADHFAEGWPVADTVQLRLLVGICVAIILATTKCGPCNTPTRLFLAADSLLLHFLLVIVREFDKA